jgi:hypothetical protein
MFGPSFVYVRFRCSRCKKLGEQFVKQEDWENGILKDATTEVAEDEKSRFANLGPIEMQEMAAFHKELDGLGDLKALRDEFEKSNTPSNNSDTNTSEK